MPTSNADSWAASKRKAREELEANENNYYFLKLPADYFNRPYSKLILKSGDAAFTLYLRLMVESIPTKGKLRFSSKTPYSARLLARVLYSNVTEETEKFVDDCLAEWIEFGIIERYDDGTLFIEEVPELLISQSANAKRVQEQRKSKKDSNKMYAEKDEEPVYDESLEDDEETQQTTKK